MAQRLRELFPDRSAQHALGAELRRLRIDHRLSQARLGELVHHSGALVGKIEKGERLPTAEFCALVDTALDTGGRLSRMRPAADPRGGVPIEFVVSPWNLPTSLHLLRELAGRKPPGRELVALTDANRDILLAGWRAALPTPVASASPGAPSQPTIGPAALDLIAARLAHLEALTDTMSGPILRDLVLAELRCLTDLIDNTAPPHRRLLALAAQAALLGARLHLDPHRPGHAQSFYLAALRCTADADDPHTGTDILAEIDHQLTHPNAGHYVGADVAPAPAARSTAGSRSAAARRASSRSTASAG